MASIRRFQLLKCEDLLILSVLQDYKLNIFAFLEGWFYVFTFSILQALFSFILDITTCWSDLSIWFITATYMMWSINECNWCILSCYQFIKQSPHSLNTYVAFGVWCSTAVCLFSMKRRNESVWHFGKYDCLLSCQQLDKKVYTTLMSVKW